jgi:hypothetical protein
MRTLTKLLLMVGLALTVSTSSANAMVTLGLVQVGGTYSASVGAQPGDTLVLNITWSADAAFSVVTIDPGLVFNGSVQSFNVAGSTETGPALNASYASIAPLATGDIALTAGGIANGWEKATLTPWTGPCVLGACTSMGTAAFVLTGQAGVIVIGGNGRPGGTVVGDGAAQDVTMDPSKVTLGSFTIVPEPTTASLLGLGLLGLTVAGRRRS